MSFFKAFIAHCATDAATAAARLRQSAKPRVDDNLPFGWRIGTRLSFGDEMPFILAQGCGHLVSQKPPVQPIVAYGRGEIDGMRFHRFYLGGGDHMIQVIVDQSNRVIAGETCLYHLHHESFPSTRDQLSVWMPVKGKPGETDEEYQVGFVRFDMPDWAKDKDKTYATYLRAWPNFDDQTPQGVPRKSQERIYADPFDGEANVLLRRDTMLYGRNMGEGNPPEWIMLSYTERGPEMSPKEMYVQVHAGLTIDDPDQILAA